MTPKLLHPTVLAAALALAFAAPGHAADMDVVYADDANYATPAELGTGWYIRGDISYNLGGWRKFGTENDGPLQYDTSIGDQIGFGGGVGFQFNDSIRLELSADRLFGAKRSARERASSTNCPGMTWTEVYDEVRDTTTTFFAPDFIGNCVRDSKTEYQIYDVMASAYYDLPEFWGVRPYVSGGLGVGIVDWEISGNDFICTPAAEETGVRQFCVPTDTSGAQPGIGQQYTNKGATSGSTDLELAWSVGLGASYALSKNMNFDLGYRYLSVNGGKKLTYANGGPGFEGSFGVHQVRTGLRFNIW